MKTIIFFLFTIIFMFSCYIQNEDYFDEQKYKDFFYGNNESFYQSAKPFYIQFGFPNIIEEQIGDYHFVYYWYTKIQYKVSFLENFADNWIVYCHGDYPSGHPF